MCGEIVGIPIEIMEKTLLDRGLKWQLESNENGPFILNFLIDSGEWEKGGMIVGA